MNESAERESRSGLKQSEQAAAGGQIRDRISKCRDNACAASLRVTGSSGEASRSSTHGE
jgi:hypothetical protein